METIHADLVDDSKAGLGQVSH